MPLGEDEVVVARVIRVVPVVAEVPADQDRQQVGGGHARRRMPGPRRGTRTDGVNTQLLTKLGGEREIGVGRDGWGRHKYLLNLRFRRPLPVLAFSWWGPPPVGGLPRAGRLWLTLGV